MMTVAATGWERTFLSRNGSPAKNILNSKFLKANKCEISLTESIFCSGVSWVTLKYHLCLIVLLLYFIEIVYESVQRNLTL